MPSGKPKYNSLMKSTPWWQWWYRRRDQYKDVFRDKAIRPYEANKLATGDIVRRNLQWWKNRDDQLRLVNGEPFLPVAWYDLALKNLGTLPIPVHPVMRPGKKSRDFEGSDDWVMVHEESARSDMGKWGSMLDSDFSEYADVSPRSMNEDWRTTYKPLPVRKNLRRMDEFKGKSASPRDIVQWVADNLTVKNVRPKDCPCPAAWSLLHNALSSQSAESKFWEIWGRFLPTRAQVEKEADLVEGGREPKKLLEGFMLARKWEDTKMVAVGGNGET